MVGQGAGVKGDGVGACGVGGDLEAVGLVLHLVAQVAQAEGEACERLGEVGLDQGGVVDAAVGERAGLDEAEELLEECAGVCLRLDDALDNAVEQCGVLDGCGELGEIPLAGVGVVEDVEVMLDAAFAQGKAEVVACAFFEVVGFVEDDVLILREEPGVLLTEFEVGKEDGVVADEQVGRVDGLARLLVEAGLVAWALAAHAVVGVALDAVPYAGAFEALQALDGAVVGVHGPVFDDVQRAALGGVGEEGVLAFAGLFEPADGDVVATPFDEHGHQRHARGVVQPPGGHGLLQQGDVFFEQLLLEVDGVRGDDDALVVGDAAEDGRDEVGKTFARARAGLGDEGALAGEGSRDALGEFELLGPRLEARAEVVGDRPTGTQYVPNGVTHGAV